MRAGSSVERVLKVGCLGERFARAFDSEVIGERVDVERRPGRRAPKHLEKPSRGREPGIHLEQEVAAQKRLFVLAVLREIEGVPKGLKNLVPCLR